VPEHTRPGDVLAGRYRLTDLLTESAGGRFWRAFDSVLQRDVAVHIIACSDERAPLLREAARTSATVLDRRMLRVLDIDEAADRCYVVNEWGDGTSIDILLADAGPLPPGVAAWITAEVADTIALAHDAGVAHGRLVPENVLVDRDGAVRLIGFAVDAALHGLPSGRIKRDVVDLTGLLYACLTGKWAGASRSAVPGAPLRQGHVLRPRQVRAGIPRTLDSLCDHVLNRGGDVDVTADMISESLRDFLGDATGAAASWLAHIEHAQPGTDTVVLPALPDPPVRDPDAIVEPGADVPTDETGVEGDLATQAGMPIFHDDREDVTWLSHSSDPAPPPPPFDPPPPRPLFAPDPGDGEPARRPRLAPTPGTRPSGSGYWPWDNDSATGSGIFPPLAEDDEDDERTPGRTQLRLAAIIAACLLLLLACVIAFNLGRGRTPLGQPTDKKSSTTTSQTTAPAQPTTYTGLTARDFDPQGVPPEEHPTEAPLVIDRNPATGWQTMTYAQNFGAGGLKTGVGVILDLGAVKPVNEVALTMVGTPTTVQVFITRTTPTGVSGLSPAGTATLTSTHGTVTISPAASGRFVTIWLTSLPAADGGFRGEIAEAEVKGG
jgi:hypothetical protein